MARTAWVIAPVPAVPCLIRMGRTRARFWSSRACLRLELGAGFHPELDQGRNVFLERFDPGLVEARVRASVRRHRRGARRARPIIDIARANATPQRTWPGFSVAINVDPDVLLIRRWYSRLVTSSSRTFRRSPSQVAGRRSAGPSADDRPRGRRGDLAGPRSGARGQGRPDRRRYRGRTAPSPGEGDAHLLSGLGKVRFVGSRCLTCTGRPVDQVCTGRWSPSGPTTRPANWSTTKPSSGALLDGVLVTGPNTVEVEVGVERRDRQRRVNLEVPRGPLLSATDYVAESTTCTVTSGRSPCGHPVRRSRLTARDLRQHRRRPSSRSAPRTDRPGSSGAQLADERLQIRAAAMPPPKLPTRRPARCPAAWRRVTSRFSSRT